MHFITVKSKTLKIILAVVAAMILLSINFGGSASAEVFFNKTNKKVPIYRVDTSEKNLSITFDAAWGSDKTLGILDTLKKYDCDATFFLVGFWVDKYPDIVKKIYDSGFEIGIHSNTHPDLAKMDAKSIKLELETCMKKISDITGFTPTLFRAPFGSYNNTVIEVAEGLNLKVIQWDVDSLDWRGISANEISKNILTKAKEGSIILTHNNSDHILDALPTVLQCLKDKGFKFTSVGKLIYQDNYTIDQAGVQKKN